MSKPLREDLDEQRELDTLRQMPGFDRVSPEAQKAIIQIARDIIAEERRNRKLAEEQPPD